MTESAFLTRSLFPFFDQYKAQEIEPAVDSVLQENTAKLDSLLKQEEISWSSVVEALSELQNHLQLTWSPISHLNSVISTGEWRSAYEKCLPKLTDYHLGMAQNTALFQKIKQLSESGGDLTLPQRTVVSNYLRDFHLAGIDLPPEAQARFNELSKELEQKTTAFANHVMDATDQWSLLITDVQELAGLPENSLAYLQHNAKEKDEEGYLITLNYPSYIAIMQNADSAALRKTVHEAFSTRASDIGPHDKALDNTGLIEEILKIRMEVSTLLGFDSYADRSLATKMVDSPERVFDFLWELADKALPSAERDMLALEKFAKETYQIKEIEASDMAYLSEKLRQRDYSLSQEELKPYFPLPTVLSGLFELIHTLFDVNIDAEQEALTWHSDVLVYRLSDAQKEPIAWIYLDLYARDQKRGGAWMDELKARYFGGETKQLPMAFVVCNFEAPVGDKPALLSHDDVVTLFHEFGHALHHMLTVINEIAVSGINGVPWDGVELPSQLLENFCWSPKVLKTISQHIETQESLPDAVVEKLLAAKNFQSGLQLVRQLEFALFDFSLHACVAEESVPNAQEVIDEIREKVRVTPLADYDRFQNAFTHIFAGGYAAGYYSYLWAEVLSADAFDVFEQAGVISPEVGKQYLQLLLSQGGSDDFLKLFVDFRGREPDNAAFLRHRGFEE